MYFVNKSYYPQAVASRINQTTVNTFCVDHIRIWRSNVVVFKGK